MNKKVGVFTFHTANNCGAVLQAYALTEKIKSINNGNAFIIDYQNEFLREKASGGFVKKILLTIYYLLKGRGFAAFRKKHLTLSDICYNADNIEQCVNECDIVVCGSDQIWNLSCSGYDYSYFLPFNAKGIKKVAYAVSIGNYSFSNEERNKIKPYLDDFARISVRESTAKDDVLFADSSIKVIPDPVFLLSKEQWQGIIPGRLTQKKYVFVYIIQQDVSVTKAAKEYAKKHNLEVISNKSSIQFMLKNSPDNFLSWILNAECVFTNSFHGLSFSLILDKPVCVDITLSNGDINHRLNDLICSVEANGCVIGSKQDTDRDAVNKNVERLSNIGAKYLADLIL